MSNLVDIQSQIEKLQRQASEIKAKEFDKTVQDIAAKMHAFGITVKDLQTATSRSKAKATPSKRSIGKVKKGAVTTVAAKYRGPNGETWSGRGLTPKWLVALVASGKAKEEFAIHH
jgi:DNA-binding protein H-NS